MRGGRSNTNMYDYLEEWKQREEENKGRVKDFLVGNTLVSFEKKIVLRRERERERERRRRRRRRRRREGA